MPDLYSVLSQWTFTICQVCGIYGEGQMSHRSVFKWVSKFTANRILFRLGRPPTTTTKSNILKITDLLNQDARYTVRDLERLANFSLARVNSI